MFMQVCTSKLDGNLAKHNTPSPPLDIIRSLIRYMNSDAPTYLPTVIRPHRGGK